MVIERPSTDTDDEVVTSARDGVGWIVLNRPRAINALTTGMIEQIDAALDRWEHDGSVRVIVLAGAGERGLCAGGDVVAVRAAGLAGDLDAGRFFEREYDVDLRLATSSVLVVAVMDGVVMGGGLGLSAFAAHRKSSHTRTPRVSPLRPAGPPRRTEYNTAWLVMLTSRHQVHMAFALGLVSAWVSRIVTSPSSVGTLT